MADLTRRQISVSALSIVAASALPSAMVTTLTTLDAGDLFDREQADWIRDIAEMHANYRRADRTYFHDQNARDEWWLCHHELASNADMLRKDTLGGRYRQRLICDWLDGLYSGPAMRAYSVPPRLGRLSNDCKERQAELDDITFSLGEADYRLQTALRIHHWSYTDSRVRPMSSAIDKLIRQQHLVAGSFAHLQVETPDDMSAMRRAATTYQGCNWVCTLNARRRRWLRLHA